MIRSMHLLAAMVVLSVALGCGEAPSQTSGGRASGVLWLTAASTTDAATELAALFESRTGVRVRITTGGSNALATQIMAGVPGEVFLSANARWADAVVERGLAVQSRPLLSNRLVIVAPRGNPAQVSSPSDLLSGAVRRVALAGEKVPAGLYAEQALDRAGVYDRLVADHRIARGQDVRLTLGYVEAGEAEAGVVYASDARASDRVEVVYTFAADAHDAIVYPLVLLKSPADRASSGQDAGRRLYEFLFSPEAMAVFEQHGFSAAP